MKKLAFGILAIFLFSTSHGSTIHAFVNVAELAQRKSKNSASPNLTFTAPYYLLNNLKYTYDTQSFLFEDKQQLYTLTLLDTKEPNRIHWRIQNKTDSPIDFAQTENQIKNTLHEIEKKIPWWSNKSLEILKSLDFTHIDGKKDFYALGNQYHLKLMSHQGAWGRVYLLEQEDTSLKSKAICVVKVLWNRPSASMTSEEFQKRHKQEVQNTLRLSTLDIAMQPYGIIKNNDNNYLLFLEQGNDSRGYFEKQPKEKMYKELNAFIKEVNNLHRSGFTHGDLTLNNMLYLNNKIKLCDWFSLKDYGQIAVKDYFYKGDNLPPEAILAFYYKNTKAPLSYAIVDHKGKTDFRMLHPVAADRFCLAVSLLEIIAPDIYHKFETAFPKDFNPYKPESLAFLQPYLTVIKEAQNELRQRAKETKDHEEKILLEQLASFIDVEPYNRKIQEKIY